MPAAQHRKFDDGINQDIASFLLGEGYVYSSKSMLYDKIGIARKRGGITGIGATTTYKGDHLGALLKDDGTTQLYHLAPLAYGAGRIAAINSATGVATDLSFIASVQGVDLPDGGRPFQHYGFMIWPIYTNNPAASPVGINATAGATGAVAQYAFTAPASVAMTAGDKLITCAVADSPLTHLQVGQIIEIAGFGGPNVSYIGRVTRLVSSTSFEVYPTPTRALGSAPATVIAFNAYDSAGATGTGNYALIGGKVGMSFQGRVLLGNCNRWDPFGANRLESYPRRIWFSPTLLEQDVNSATTLPYQGAVFLSQNAFPPLNYFDIPVQEEITAMGPTGFGDALIFSAYRTFRLTGNLTTQYGTDQSITWSPREIPNSVGCMSERSLQRTPRGMIFAHDSGIYATDGSSMQPLMYKRIQDLWKGLVGGGSFKIYGSALLRGNHYYICGTSGGVLWGLMVNLDTLAWGPFIGKTTAPASWIINSAVQDPASPSRIWGLKWFSGASASMTGGQLLKLEDAFNPSSANRADSDGTTVGLEIVTRPYTEDSPTVQKVFMGATIEYENLGGAGIGVTPFFNLDAAEIPATGTTSALPRQDSYVVTAGTNAAPIVLTIGAGHNIPQGAWVRVVGVGGLTKANGLWRVGAVTGTTITLLGSVGNAAYTSGGTVTCVDARDISLLNAVTAAGQDPAAVVYRINDTDLGGAAGADSFELYGITHTWEARELHEQ